MIKIEGISTFFFTSVRRRRSGLYLFHTGKLDMFLIKVLSASKSPGKPEMSMTFERQL